ncbi:unnamed protein product [Ranitomeya imitator]|uniref:Uncharacterized protein n=1 Tax=Ranitomeya imitator TaxID=111125 RepID=A0ABN9M5F4_9NEOB|nr:unnamed protein product [Ranitomeya imitator]
MGVNEKSQNFFWKTLEGGLVASETVDMDGKSAEWKNSMEKTPENLASASCMSRCANSCQQTQIADVTCLQRALAKNKVATIRAIANVLCAYDRSKAMRNKMELIKALRLLQEPTRCDLLRGFTMEELNSDVDNTMQDALWTLVNVLSPLNVGYLSTPLCGPLGPLVAKITQMLYTRGIPNLDGIWNVAGINGGKGPLGTVTNVSPGLVNLVLKLLLGDEKGLLSGVTGTVGGLTSAVTDLTGSTTRLISDLLGGINVCLKCFSCLYKRGVDRCIGL